MSYEFQDFKFAPDVSVEGSAIIANEVIEANNILPHETGGVYCLKIALQLAPDGRTSDEVQLVRLVDEFDCVLRSANNDTHYDHMIETLRWTLEINSAIRTKQHMVNWDLHADASRAGTEDGEKHAIDRIIEVHRQMVDERKLLKPAFNLEKNRGLSVWSAAVKMRLYEFRITAITAVKSFTMKELRSVVLRFTSNPCIDGKEFLRALFFHPRVLKLKRRLNYANLSPLSISMCPIQLWFNMLCIATFREKEGGALLFERLVAVFGDWWRNDHLDFAENWDTDVYVSARCNRYCESVCPHGTDLWRSTLFATKYREAHMIDGAVRHGNVLLLKAILNHRLVDSAKVVCLINMYLAAGLSYRIHNPFAQRRGYMGAIPLEMRHFLFTSHPKKPALKPPSMYLAFPPVTDLDEYENAMIADTQLLSPHQRRLKEWKQLAAEHQSIWVQSAWPLLAQLVKAHLIAWYIYEQKLRPTYHAEFNEQRVALMIGSRAARDQEAFHFGGHVGIEAANALATVEKRVAETPLEVLFARERAKERSRIFARQEAEIAKNESAGGGKRKER